MNNNLSAGPTLEDLENSHTEINDNDTETEEKPTPDDANTNEQLSWHCPYCDTTHSELSNIRDHITETIEGDHEGVSGWSPTRDIVATNENDDEVRRIEGSGERPDEDHHLNHGDKKKLIINAWLELDKQRDVQAISSIMPASEEYVRRITKQLEDGDIPAEEFRTEMDWSVREELGERLEEYYDQQETSKPTETTQMSLTASEDEQERGAKKKQIINAWLLDPEVSPSDLEEILSSSYEYIRREVKKLKDSEIDQEEIEAAVDENLQSQIREELENIGVEISDANADVESVTIDTDTDTGEQPAYMDTLENATKKTRIINSVLLSRALDEDIHYTDMADAAGCSDEYARRTTNDIRDEELSESDVQDASDDDLQQALRQYYEDHDVIGTTSEDTDTVNIDLSNEDDPFENTDVSKREALVNIFLYRPDISKADAGDLAGASAEYARQTYNGIQDGDYDHEEYQNEAIQNTLEELEESGDLAAFLGEEPDEPETTEEPETEAEAEADAQSVEAEAETTEEPTTVETTSSPESMKGMVPASEIKGVREIADMLYRQAQYESDGEAKDKKAEFIAKEMRDRLDTLLDQAA